MRRIANSEWDAWGLWGNLASWAWGNGLGAYSEASFALGTFVTSIHHTSHTSHANEKSTTSEMVLCESHLLEGKIDPATGDGTLHFRSPCVNRELLDLELGDSILPNSML